MISRAEWLRKYKVFKQCQEKDCKFKCNECEFIEGRHIYESELLADAEEIFVTQILGIKALFDNIPNN